MYNSNHFFYVNMGFLALLTKNATNTFFKKYSMGFLILFKNHWKCCIFATGPKKITNIFFSHNLNYAQNRYFFNIYKRYYSKDTPQQNRQKQPQADHQREMKQTTTLQNNRRNKLRQKQKQKTQHAQTNVRTHHYHQDIRRNHWEAISIRVCVLEIRNQSIVIFYDKWSILDKLVK